MSPFLNGKGLFYKKNAPQKWGNIFRRNFLFYGFIDSDACDFWIGLDLDFTDVWFRIGFWFGFSFGLDFGFLGLDVFAGFVQ
jgi:hypothetical protein